MNLWTEYRISAAEANKICESLTAKKYFSVLKLSCNYQNDQWKILTKIILKWINIPGNDAEVEGVKKMTEFLKMNTTLTVLDLSSNDGKY